ncbi:MAG: hypothetical protein ABIJ16_11485, partial [Bacteroidota bacterium]
VIMITGYPTDETKETSKNLGVLQYILKPFKPAEILDPVRKILRKPQAETKTAADTVTRFGKWEKIEDTCRFYLNAWFQAGKDGTVRIGGNIIEDYEGRIEYIKVPGVNDRVYKGLPLAEIGLSDMKKIIIPAAVSGKIIELNQSLMSDPGLLESEDAAQRWMARIVIDRPEEEMKSAEVREVLYITGNEGRSSYTGQIKNLGYPVKVVGSLNDVNEVVETAKAGVIVLDAETLGEKGPEYVSAVKTRYPDMKVIVFNTAGSELELAYREKKLFYYGVSPVSSKEISGILYSAYCLKKETEKMESNQTTFLPHFINRVEITNRYNQKVVLMAYENICQCNKGIGYLLISNLLAKLYPLQINHTRTASRMNDPENEQRVSAEKQKCNKIIMLHVADLNRIPGSITVSSEIYANTISEENSMVRIAIQPGKTDGNSFEFDRHTTIALEKIIEHEMTSK